VKRRALHITPSLLPPEELGTHQQVSEHWLLTSDGDADAFLLFRRHYSCTNANPRVRLLVGPGEKMLLISRAGDAIFAWRRTHYRLDGQNGVNCAVFRNEGDTLSSVLIAEAMEIAWRRWPGERLFTFVNPERIRSRNPGCCFKKAGWRECGRTAAGLLILGVSSPARGGHCTG
jgi:hypothetical protein